MKQAKTHLKPPPFLPPDAQLLLDLAAIGESAIYIVANAAPLEGFEIECLRAQKDIAMALHRLTDLAELLGRERDDDV